jgi:PPIC-type PPIASE domain
MKLMSIAAVLVAMLFSACNKEQEAAPLPSAAMVGTASITEDRLADWVPAFMPGIPGNSSSGELVRTSCDSLSSASGIGRARRTTPPSASRQRCLSALRFAKSEALRFLIRSAWLQREARRRNVTLAEGDFEKSLGERTRQFRRHGDFRRYLSKSGMTRAQFRWRVYRDLLMERLMHEIDAPDLAVTKTDITRFYDRNKGSFRSPDIRYIHVIVTRSNESAQRARLQLKSGRAWSEVAARFTVDDSKRTGGRIQIDKTNVISELRASVFAASIGRLVGPVDFRGAWWVFRVDRERPARQLSVSEVADRIQISIRSTREQLALDRLTDYLTRRYRPHTVCHNGYKAPECRDVSASERGGSGS